MAKQNLYKILFEHFGELNWWPGESSYEHFVGCVLAQNTRWERVAEVISRMKSMGIITPKEYLKLSFEDLAEVLKGSGTYNRKANYLRSATEFMLSKGWNGTSESVTIKTEDIRQQFLEINGIGPETCDSILLYVLDRPVFVVDAYTRRILSRHGLCDKRAKYSEIQKMFYNDVQQDAQVYKEYHALIVECAKNYCKVKPLCNKCPLSEGELSL